MYGGGGGWRGCQGRLLVLPGAVGVMEVLSLEMRRLWGVQLQPLSFQDTIKPCRVSGGQPELSDGGWGTGFGRHSDLGGIQSHKIREERRERGVG